MTFLNFLNRRTPNTGAEVPSAPVELGTRLGPATKIHYRRVCERPIDFFTKFGHPARSHDLQVLGKTYG